jgi:hypothetical protein
MIPMTKLEKAKKEIKIRAPAIPKWKRKIRRKKIIRKDIGKKIPEQHENEHRETSHRRMKQWRSKLEWTKSSGEKTSTLSHRKNRESHTIVADLKKSWTQTSYSMRGKGKKKSETTPRDQR